MSEARRTAIRRRVVTAAAISLLAISASTSWAGACQLQMSAIPVHTMHYRLVTVAKVNGRNLAMMVNSSSEYTVLSPEAARTLGLALRPLPPDLTVTTNSKKLDAQRATVRQLKTGTLELNDVEVLVSELTTGLPLSGVIGRDILGARDAEYDVSRGVIRLITPEGDCDHRALAYWAGDAPVNEVSLLDPYGEHDHRTRLQVSVNGKPVIASLGSGVQFSFLLPEAARAAGIRDEQLRSLHAPGALNASNAAEPSAARFVELDSLQIGAERFTRQPIEVEPFEAEGAFDMMLGVDYLLSHRIYLSQARGKLYATRNAFPAFRNHGSYSPGSPEAEAFDKAVQALQDDADVWARVGFFHFRSQRLREALDAMNRAIALRPDTAEFFQTRARIQQARGDAPSAVNDLDEAVRLDPGHAEIRAMRAVARDEAGQPEGALADADEADRRLPSGADIRFELARVYGHQGRVDEAVRQWTMWIESHPEDIGLVHAYNERCYLRTRRDVDLPLALQDCERAVALDAKSSAFQDSLGWVRLRSGDLAGARAAFDDALRLQADLAWSLYGRSWAWLKQGDAARAREDLAAARKRMPDIDRRIRELGLPVHESPL